MRAILAPAIVAASLAAALPLRAETGEALFGQCAADKNNHWQRGLCADNIQRVVETLSSMAVKGRTLSSLANYCPAEGVGEEAVINGVADWLRQNPQHRHFDASLLILVALAETWPCAD